MVRKSVPAGRRGFGAALSAGGLGVLVVVTVAACGSAADTNGASGTASSSVPVVAASTSGSAVPSASASTGGAVSSAPTSAAASSTANHPMIPTNGVLTSPKAQVPSVPSGGKLTAFDSAERSKDGMTLYLGLESQGGACGQYDVVVQQTSTSVSVGLVHLPSGARVCPMYVTRILIPAKLSSPLGGRSVVDLQNGQVVQTPILP